MRSGLLAAAAAALLLPGCSLTGADAGPEPPPAQEGAAGVATSPPPDPGPVAVHAMAINPADGSLVLAAQTGFFRVDGEGVAPARLGESRLDARTIAAAGPDRLLASGRPMEGDTSAPEALGLMASLDGGQSWQPLALTGEAELGAIATVGGSVFAYDVTNDRFLISRNGGLEWVERSTPEPVLDLAYDPADGEHLVASTRGGLYASPDGGATWRRLGGMTGSLAWPGIDRLYLVAPDGTVSVSADAGRSFERVGEAGGEAGALVAAGPDELFVATGDAVVKHSADGGATWNVFSAPETVG